MNESGELQDLLTKIEVGFDHILFINCLMSVMSFVMLNVIINVKMV